jgi:hypothetical protein
MLRLAGLQGEITSGIILSLKLAFSDIGLNVSHVYGDQPADIPRLP